MTALIDKDIEVLIITIFRVFKKLKEIWEYHIETWNMFFLKTYTELLDKKTIESSMKNTLDETNSRLDIIRME